MSIADFNQSRNLSITPAVQQPLSIREKNELFKYILRCDPVFQRARACWQPEFFDTDVDITYRMLWDAITRVVARQGSDTLPPRLQEMLRNEIPHVAETATVVHEVVMDALLGPQHMGPDGQRTGGVLQEMFTTSQADLDATLAQAYELLQRVEHQYGDGGIVKDFAVRLNGQLPTRESIDGLILRLQEQAERRPTGRLELMSSAALCEMDCRHEWLVPRVLVAGQPMILGGPRKGMKTSIMVDLAVSLGFGQGVQFLNHAAFQVPERRRVAIFSGESGAATLKETFRRVCESKGQDPHRCDVHWCFELPQLSNDSDLRQIATSIRRNHIEVVMFDPIYLSLLSGNPNASAANLFDVGPLLSRITKVCLDAGATPIFVHHNTKTKAKPYDVPELEDMAFAGFQEFARQWILVGRREKFEPGTGNHKLWMNVGGSAGFSNCYAVDITEGVVQEDFGGRRWEVSVRTQAEEIQQERRTGIDRRATQIIEEQQKIERALNHYGQNGATASMVAAFAEVGEKKARGILDRMVQAGHLQPCKVERGGGQGGRRLYDGYRWPHWRQMEAVTAAVSRETATAGGVPAEAPSALPDARSEATGPISPESSSAQQNAV